MKIIKLFFRAMALMCVIYLWTMVYDWAIERNVSYLYKDVATIYSLDKQYYISKVHRYNSPIEYRKFLYDNWIEAMNKECYIDKVYTNYSGSWDLGLTDIYSSTWDAFFHAPWTTKWHYSNSSYRTRIKGYYDSPSNVSWKYVVIKCE